MCGIAGFVYKDFNRIANFEKIKAMTDIIKHRGPDDEGHYIDGCIALGHRRLSILDLSVTGHQPMYSCDNQYVIVFNGEIYNYIELRKELVNRGCKFKSTSDTEVILESYRVWKEDCVNHFNGMWSFVIYDINKKKLFISRDRFGIKPLYYLNRADVFAFASEIKSILAGFDDERQPNDSMIRYFLEGNSIDDGEETFFKNILILEPAHSAIYDVRNHTLKIWKYWDANEEQCYNKWVKDNDPIETLQELIKSSINVHMRSDVPLGVCLSGGIDSSSIVGVSTKILNKSLYTFSSVYKDITCNEKEYIDEVNKFNNAMPNLVYPEPNGNLLEDISKITWYHDGPNSGASLYSQYSVMKEAHKKVKVVLDGQGADELFGGYFSYFNNRIKDILNQGTFKSRMEALKLILLLNKFSNDNINTISTDIMQYVLGNIAFKKFDKKYLSKKFNTYSSSYALFTDDFLFRTNDKKLKRDFPIKMRSNLNNRLYWDISKTSIPELLHNEDRNSMAFSIESRVPFLDYRIMEFAIGLPGNLKIKDGWTKWILRKSCEKYMPKSVSHRRSKLGFPAPFGRWIKKGNDKSDILDILFSNSFFNRGIVPKDTIESHYKEHMQGKIDRSTLIYKYITIELWYRMFIDNFRPFDNN